MRCDVIGICIGTLSLLTSQELELELQWHLFINMKRNTQTIECVSPFFRID